MNNILYNTKDRYYYKMRLNNLSTASISGRKNWLDSNIVIFATNKLATIKFNIDLDFEKLGNDTLNVRLNDVGLNDIGLNDVKLNDG